VVRRSAKVRRNSGKLLDLLVTDPIMAQQFLRGREKPTAIKS
jgi:hypothetical protein